MNREARYSISLPVYAAVILVLGVLSSASVANHTVNVSNEAEYRDALTDLSAGDTSPHTINVTADITIAGATDPTYAGTQDLTINGNGFTLDAANNSRVLFHQSTADLNISDLTATNGTTSGNGGGILSTGSVTVTNSTISANSANSGGGISLTSTGSVTVTNSTITGNTAAVSGAG